MNWKLTITASDGHHEAVIASDNGFHGALTKLDAALEELDRRFVILGFTAQQLAETTWPGGTTL